MRVGVGGPRASDLNGQEEMIHPIVSKPFLDYDENAVVRSFRDRIRYDQMITITADVSPNDDDSADVACERKASSSSAPT